MEKLKSIISHEPGTDSHFSFTILDYLNLSSVDVKLSFFPNCLLFISFHLISIRTVSFKLDLSLALKPD